MKTNLVVATPIYTVDTKNRVIICTIKAVPKGIKDLSYASYMANHRNKDIISKDYIIEATGKARCSKEDLFNIKIGKKIAESRAKIKLYSKASTFFRQITHLYESILSGSMITWICNNDTLKQLEKDHLKRLCQ